MSRRISQGVLVVGSIGVLINIVDAIGTGRVEPHDAFAALVVLGAGGELLKERRPRAAKAMYAVASVLLVIAGSVAGARAWASFFRGAAYDWLDLGLGVLVVLYVAVGAGQLLAHLSRRASKSGRAAPLVELVDTAFDGHPPADALSGSQPDQPDEPMRSRH